MKNQYLYIKSFILGQKDFWNRKMDFYLLVIHRKLFPETINLSFFLISLLDFENLIPILEPNKVMSPSYSYYYNLAFHQMLNLLQNQLVQPNYDY